VPGLTVLVVLNGAQFIDSATATDRSHRCAVTGQRLTVPDLLMVPSELGTLLKLRYSSDASAAHYLDELRHPRFRTVHPAAAGLPTPPRHIVAADQLASARRPVHDIAIGRRHNADFLVGFAARTGGAREVGQGVGQGQPGSCRPGLTG
jgi:hypothetical protein